MNRDNILMLLCAQGYPEFMLEQTADKVEKLSYDIAKAFEDWVEDGTIPTMEICGYSYDKLIKNFNMRPIAAFLALDWLVREPEKASEALKRGIRKLKV